jgi:hypothetical protein
VKIDGKFGFIDKTGQPLFPPRFIKCAEFRGGLAWACEAADSCGYIRADGKYVWKGKP